MRTLLKSFSGELRWDEPLSKHTYYKIGGPCVAMAFPASLDELAFLDREAPYRVLGLGSNVLVSDQGIPGLIVKTSKLNSEMSVQGNRLQTGSGLSLYRLLRMASEQGWGGLEFLAGIPGTVGGAVVMNAGTHLGEVKDKLVSVDYFYKGNLHRVTDLKFEYRTNLFLPTGAIVWSAIWDISLQEPALVRSAVQEVLHRRIATQPVELPSCGSVFKNPVASGLKAWQVIDRLGLRGYQVGGAQFSPKHANFIVNLGHASANDVRQLIGLAQNRARSDLGLNLEPEVKFFGFEEEGIRI